MLKYLNSIDSKYYPKVNFEKCKLIDFISEIKNSKKFTIYIYEETLSIDTDKISLNMEYNTIEYMDIDNENTDSNKEQKLIPNFKKFYKENFGEDDDIKNELENVKIDFKDYDDFITFFKKILR